MTITYASLLATTKFRTRLGRSIVTVIAASLVASIMLVAVFVLTGFQESITSISQTALSKQNLAQQVTFTTGNANTKQSTPSPALTLSQYQASIAQYAPTKVYEDINIASYNLTNPVITPTDGQSTTTETVSARSDTLYTESLDTTSPPAAVSGTVPAAIGTDVVLALAKITLSDSDTSAYRISQTLAAEKSWRGKVLTLTMAEPAMNSVETLKVTIQGFLPVGGLFGGGQPSNSILLPLSAAQSAITPFPTSTESNTTFYAAFSSQAALLNFVQNETSPRSARKSGSFTAVEIYANPFLQFQEIENQIKNVLKYVIIGLLIAVALAIMTTLSKIISDSERETGVFRAIGARVTDILQIYIGYSTIVSVLAMLLALGIGASLSAWISNRESDRLTSELLTITGSSNITTHVSLFGINYLEIGGVFLAIFLAALIGTLIPLIGLLRRDPIKALRAE